MAEVIETSKYFGKGEEESEMQQKPNPVLCMEEESREEGSTGLHTLKKAAL